VESRNRIYVLDVLRGFAILGILLPNITGFAKPGLSFVPGSAPPKGADAWIEAATQAFASGKFRSMLALLFGVGLYLQWSSFQASGRPWPGRYLRRMAILAALGLVHGLFLWHGDILFLYGCVGFVAAFLAGLSTKHLKTIFAVIAALAGLLAMGLVALTFLSVGMGSGAGELDIYPFRQGDELRIFQRGGYGEQLIARAVYFGVTTIAMLIGFAVFVLGLFVLGIVFGRSGVLAAPSRHPRTRNAALLFGLGLGLPLNLLALGMVGNKNADVFQGALEFFLGPLLAVGYTMGIAVVVEKGALRRVAAGLAMVGRVALTTYLSQSLICTFLFYSYGFGLFGKLTHPQMLLVVLGVWVFNLAFAHFWLSRFSIGPVEWLWRSLSEGKRKPWRAETGEPSPPPVQVYSGG